MTESSDEDLLAAIGTDPDALPAFYLRHIAKVTGMGVRRFDQPEDVADFVANVFLEVLRSVAARVRLTRARRRRVHQPCGSPRPIDTRAKTAAGCAGG